jgi:hypothetical protein
LREDIADHEHNAEGNDRRVHHRRAGHIRRELDQFFSTLPTVADGFLLKTWRSGPQAGQPKLPLPAKGLVERGLMRIDTTQRWPRLLFTETGLVALRTMMTDRRLANPARYAHIRRELGIDPNP